MRNLLIIGLIVMFTGCVNNVVSEFTDVKVKEVEQVGNYTYLLVKAKKGPEYWVAAPTMVASAGESYHYQGGWEMVDFYSKELDRTFEKVMFIEALFTGSSQSGSSQSNLSQSGSMPQGSMGAQGTSHGGKVATEKTNVKVEAVEGTTSIADLFADPGSFEGKSIKVRGEVTKYNPAIMELNWVHVQDGTEFEGKFDLTATSNETFSEGSVVTIEGIVALNKDFGYGYSYDILLEKATAVE